jgi:hypothetical protein
MPAKMKKTSMRATALAMMVIQGMSPATARIG